MEILRPIIPTAKVSKEAGDKSGSTSFDWYPNSTGDRGGTYEATDKNGNVIYPQTGKARYSYSII